MQTAYSRVLLPYYLSRKISWKALFLNHEDYYRRHAVTTFFCRSAMELDVHNRTVKLSKGYQIQYDQLLIATGSSPIKPHIENISSPVIFHLWTQADAVSIEKQFCAGKKLVVLGSGFISLMAAEAAVNRGLEVTIVELMPRIMPRVLDESSAALMSNHISAHGVVIKAGAQARRVNIETDDSITLLLQDHSFLTADIVIVGTGVKPNIDFVRNSPVKVDKGILVDNRMRTNVAGIYAAGDVPQGPNVFGDKHVTAPPWFTAVEQGKIAGANISEIDCKYEG
jgi:nitrite reductase (NADH) large subunit